MCRKLRQRLLIAWKSSLQSANCQRGVQADCLEEEEVQQRKAEMQRLMGDGLRVFTFPEAIVNAITDAPHGLSHTPAAVSPPPAAPPPKPQAPPGPAFRLPFNVVAGNHADVSVHNFWFVRVYRYGQDSTAPANHGVLAVLRIALNPGLSP